MFQAYSNNTTTYTQNTPVTFSTTKYSNCRVKDTSGTAFRISAPGNYLVSFSGIGASGTATSVFSVQLYKDGVALPETATSITSVAANDVGTLNFSTIVRVLPSCAMVDNAASLQVIVTSEASGTLTNPDIIIVRI